MIIGAVNFLNAYPLYWALESNPDHNLVKDTPSNLSEKLIKGEVDLAIISSIEYFKNREILSYYPDLGISAKGKVISIRIFLKENIHKEFYEKIKNSEPVKIFYDSATRSSLAMLQIILNELNSEKEIEYVKIRPPYENILENIGENEIVLLIGDNALKNKFRPSIDLGEVYYQLFKRSFVYAVWVYRTSNSENARDLLLNAYNKSKNQMDEMINDAVETFGFDHGFTKDYLTNTINYEMNDEMIDDLEFFFTKYGRLKHVN